MRNIIVENYLRVSRDLIGKNLFLDKPNEISFFLEVCRIKQIETLAKRNMFCKDFDEDLYVNKKSLIGVINKNTLRDNREMLKLESSGIKYGDDIIIHRIMFDKRRGEFTVEFDEYNFMKYFIYFDKNFVKVPTNMFFDLKSKNSCMLLLWIFKYQNVKGYKFITKDDLCFIMDKNIETVRSDNLKRDLDNALKQIFKLEILKSETSSLDKNGNFILPVIQFDVNIKLEKIKDKTKKEKIVYDVTEEEIRLYANNENNY